MGNRKQLYGAVVLHFRDWSPRFSQLISDEVEAIANCGCLLTPDGAFLVPVILGESGVAT